MSILEYKTNLTGWYAADAYGQCYPFPNESGNYLVDLSGLDVSGINRTFVGGTFNAGPAYGQQFLNGRPVFSGTNAGLFGGPPLSTYFLAGVNAKIVVAVVRVDSVATNNAGFENSAIFGMNSTTSGGVSMVVKNTVPPTLCAVGYDGVGVKTASIPITLGQWGIAIFQHYNGALIAGWNDEFNLGTPVATGTIPDITKGLNLMVSNGLTAALNGALAEIIFYYDSSIIPQATQTLHLAKICNYLRAKWLSPNNVIGSPSMRADALEQARDVGTRKLWFMRQPLPMVGVRAPLWVALDADTLTDLAISTPLGPSPYADGAGWKNSRPERRRMRLYTSSIDLDKLGDAQLTLADLRNVEHVYQETAVALRASSMQRQGIANSGAARGFQRGFVSYIVDPGSGAVVGIDASAEKVTVGGLLLEDGGRNMLLRSCFISGLTGIATSGTGTGATIALDTAPPAGFLFDGSVTPNSLKLNLTATGTSGVNTALVAVHPTVTVPGTSGGMGDITSMVLSIDHVEDSIPSGSSGFGYRIIRVSDGAGWDAALGIFTTTRGATLNPIPLSTAGISRFSTAIASASSNWPTFPSGATFLVGYGWSSGLAAVGVTHTAHVYQAELVSAVIPSSSNLFGAVRFNQGNEPYFPSARIVTDAAVADRLGDNLAYFNHGAGVLAPSVGTFRFKFVPNWNTSDLRFDMAAVLGAANVHVGYGKTNTFFACGPASATSVSGTPSMVGPYSMLQYDPVLGQLLFSSIAATSGGTAAALTCTFVAGTTYRITCRWTSPTEGELGLPGNTISVFRDGVKGTDAVATSSALAAHIEPFFWSNTGAVIFSLGPGYLKTPNGVISQIESLGIALTDQEIATWR